MENLNVIELKREELRKVHGGSLLMCIMAGVAVVGAIIRVIDAIKD